MGKGAAGSDGAELIPAGELLPWLDATRRAQQRGLGMDVPCGDCNACCRSSYFIHIRPDEGETLAAIPPELLFPAPGLPAGNVLLGFDEHGHCPMLRDGACSIYASRPLTCRSYDCRVFAATGLDALEPDKQAVAEQARRWRFDCESRDADQSLTALRAAAKFLNERAELFPSGFIPANSTQLAMLAIKVFDVFLEDAPSDAARARAVVEAAERFDAESSSR